MASSTAKKSAALTATTSVFVSGNSQAVRLPKEFRVNSRTLEIFRRGDEIVLRERSPTIAELLEDFPPLTKKEAREFDTFAKSAKAALPPLTEPDLSWIDEVAPVTKPRSRKRIGGKR